MVRGQQLSLRPGTQAPHPQSWERPLPAQASPGLLAGGTCPFPPLPSLSLRTLLYRSQPSAATAQFFGFFSCKCYYLSATVATTGCKDCSPKGCHGQMVSWIISELAGTHHTSP